MTSHGPLAGFALLGAAGIDCGRGAGRGRCQQERGRAIGPEDRGQGQHHPANGSAAQGSGQVGQQEPGMIPVPRPLVVVATARQWAPGSGDSRHRLLAGSHARLYLLRQSRRHQTDPA